MKADSIRCEFAATSRRGRPPPEWEQGHPDEDVGDYRGAAPTRMGTRLAETYSMSAIQGGPHPNGNKSPFQTKGGRMNNGSAQLFTTTHHEGITRGGVQ